MRSVRVKKKFKKDSKAAKKNPRFNTDKLKVVVEILQNEGVLPEEYLPHQLVGDWSPKLECHVQPDFLLIYEVDEEEVILHRCGSHSTLFN